MRWDEMKCKRREIIKVTCWIPWMFIWHHNQIQVILGGGAQVLRSSIRDFGSGACLRNDSRDLIWDWMEMQKRQGRKYEFVDNKRQLMSVGKDKDYILGEGASLLCISVFKPNSNFNNKKNKLFLDCFVYLGLFSNSHMPYDKDRDLKDTGHPSLSEMVEKTIEILSRNPKGYILIVCIGFMNARKNWWFWWSFIAIKQKYVLFLSSLPTRWKEVVWTTRTMTILPRSRWRKLSLWIWLSRQRWGKWTWKTRWSSWQRITPIPFQLTATP